MDRTLFLTKPTDDLGLYRSLLARPGRSPQWEAATTLWAALDQFVQQFPQIQVQRTGKFVDEGPIITAAALTAGFHMALHIVERLLGEQMAQAVAKGIDMEGHKPRE